MGDLAAGPQPDRAFQPWYAAIRHRAEALQRRCDTALAAAAETIETSCRRVEDARGHINSTRAILDRMQGFTDRSGQPS